ncbi:ankyrin [Glaciimonas sp. PCH181]|nr:ankyrin [Glaciimonas sp. PCH181]
MKVVRFNFLISVFFIAGCLLSCSINAAEDQADLNRQALAAGRSGNVSNFKSLIEQGAAPDTRNRVGDSLLMTAIKSGYMDIFTLLIAHGANVNLANVDHVTPLMAAAYFGRPQMAQVLIDKQADVTAVDQMHKTAMVYAAGKGQTEIVESLLRTKKVFLDTAYENGLTALMWAGASGYVPTTQALLSHGADKSLVDNRGKTVLQMAAENGYLDVVNLLQVSK